MISNFLKKLKIDRKHPHHYIIGVGITSINSKNPGMYHLKYGPVYFHNKDVKNLQDSIILATDKLFKISMDDSLKNNKCNEIVSTLSSMIISCNINECNMYHFSTEYFLNDASKWFEIIVSNCNTTTTGKDFLNSARI